MQKLRRPFAYFAREAAAALIIAALLLIGLACLWALSPGPGKFVGEADARVTGFHPYVGKSANVPNAQIYMDVTIVGVGARSYLLPVTEVERCRKGSSLRAIAWENNLHRRVWSLRPGTCR